MDTGIGSIAEWMALPQLSIIELENPDLKGSVHMVSGVSFLAADIGECARLGIIKEENVKGKLPLPMTEIVENGSKKLHRLPVELNEWVYGALSAENFGGGVFPARVEFGNYKGRYFAEMVERL